MKKSSSSYNNREDRRRSSTGLPYSTHSSTREGSYPRRRKQEKSSKREAGTVNMTSLSGPSAKMDECKETPWINLFNKNSEYSGAEHRLHYEILAYLTYMQQTPDEKKARELLMSEIRRVLHGRFYGTMVSVYGSSATGLCLPISDLDVAIKLPHVTQVDVKRVLFQLASRFKSTTFTSNVFVNHQAKVPILILETREEYGSLSVDININDESGAKGVEVINNYLTRMPALRSLVLLLKGFLRQRKLNDASRGGIGSYALVCLCIHFLQTNPSNRPQEYIDQPMESESLGFLLVDFMFYYGFTFDYKTSYISCATSPGRLLPKSEENEMLSIRCLLNPQNEVAKSVSKVGVFFQFFKDAYSVLLQLNLQDQNMLGQIICIDQKFLDQRALLAQLSMPSSGTSGRQTHYTCLTNHPLPPRPSFRNVPHSQLTWKGRPIRPDSICVQDPAP